MRKILLLLLLFLFLPIVYAESCENLNLFFHVTLNPKNPLTGNKSEQIFPFKQYDIIEPYILIMNNNECETPEFDVNLYFMYKGKSLVECSRNKVSLGPESTESREEIWCNNFGRLQLEDIGNYEITVNIVSDLKWHVNIVIYDKYKDNQQILHDVFTVMPVNYLMQMELIEKQEDLINSQKDLVEQEKNASIKLIQLSTHSLNVSRWTMLLTYFVLAAALLLPLIHDRRREWNRKVASLNLLIHELDENLKYSKHIINKKGEYSLGKSFPFATFITINLEKVIKEGYIREEQAVKDLYRLLSFVYQTNGFIKRLRYVLYIKKGQSLSDIKAVINNAEELKKIIPAMKYNLKKELYLFNYSLMIFIKRLLKVIFIRKKE